MAHHFISPWIETRKFHRARKKLQHLMYIQIIFSVARVNSVIHVDSDNHILQTTSAAECNNYKSKHTNLSRSKHHHSRCLRFAFCPKDKYLSISLGLNHPTTICRRVHCHILYHSEPKQNRA